MLHRAKYYLLAYAPRAARRPRDRVGAARARRPARGAAARGVSDAGRRAALQGGALSEAPRAVSRGAVRRARWRPRGGRHGHHPAALRLRRRGPTRSPTSSRAAGSRRTSRTATGSTAPTSACIPDYRGPGLAQALYAARQELVWALGLKGQVTAGMMSGYGAVKHRMSAEEYYEGLVAGRINDPDALDAAAGGLRVPGAAEGLSAATRSATTTACSSCSTRPRTCRAPSGRTGTRPAARESAMPSIQLKTDIPGPPQPGAAGAPRGGGADRPRQGDRRRGRAGRGRARARRGRQHVHRFRRRHRRARGRPLPAPGGAGHPGRGRSGSFTWARSSAPTSPYVRLCELLNEVTPGDVSQEDAARQQRRRGGGERGQGRARVHEAARR